MSTGIFGDTLWFMKAGRKNGFLPRLRCWECKAIAHRKETRIAYLADKKDEKRLCHDCLKKRGLPLKPRALRRNRLASYGNVAKELYARLSADGDVRETFERWRWPNGVLCEVCPSSNVYRVTVRNSKRPRPGLFRCRDCNSQFVVLSGSVFSHCRLPLWTLVNAIGMVADRPDISARLMAHVFGLNYFTALLLIDRLYIGFSKGFFCDHSFYEAKKNDKAETLMVTIKSLMPAGIDPQLRSDIMQDVAVAVLMGELPEHPSRADVKTYISKAYREFADKFKTISLDQPIGGSDEESFTVGRAMGIY